MFAGEVVADTTDALYLFETGHLPRYYFPIADVRADLLRESDHTSHCPRKGDARYWTIVAGDRESPDAVWAYPEVIEGCPDITGYVSFYWNRVDAWFEEDDEVFVHARDPYKRVDVLRSSRHVVVRIDGEVIADSQRPLLLFETSLPTRYYLPRLDVRADVLLPSSTTTRCPYKGVAEYHSVRVGDDSPRGRRVVLPVADPGDPQDRAPPVLLQRTCRHRSRRRRPGTTTEPVVEDLAVIEI